MTFGNALPCKILFLQPMPTRWWNEGRTYSHPRAGFGVSGFRDMNQRKPNGKSTWPGRATEKSKPGREKNKHIIWSKNIKLKTFFKKIIRHLGTYTKYLWYRTVIFQTFSSPQVPWVVPLAAENNKFRVRKRCTASRSSGLPPESSVSTCYVNNAYQNWNWCWRMWWTKQA